MKLSGTTQVAVCSGRNPGSIRVRLRNDRTSRPAQTSSTIEIATCATTSSPRRRTRPGLPVAPPPVSVNDGTSERPAGKAGSAPNTSPVATASVSVKNSTVPSIDTSCARGVSPAASVFSSESDAQATARPSTAPLVVSTRLSVASCRISRPRPALRHHGGPMERTVPDRHEDVVVFRIERHRRQDADDGVRPIVEAVGPADDRRIAPERLEPVGVAQHDHALRLRPVVVGAKRASVQRTDAQRVEVRGRDDARAQAFGLGAAVEDEPHLVILDDVLERAGPLAVVGELAPGESGVDFVLARNLRLEHQDAIAAVVGQRFQHDAVDDAEDRRVGADAERHRHQDRASEPAVSREHAHGDAKVLRERVQHAHAERVAAGILDVRDAAEALERPSARLAGIDALPDELRGLEREVALDLLVHVGFNPPTPHHQSERRPERAHSVHDCLP